ncbi:MAG: DUF4280 domain-containing protein [Bacteroidota bacterium]
MGKSYVCHMAKIKCPLCNGPEGQLMVTSNQIKLQGNFFATEKDNKKANLLFSGTCKKSPFQSSPCAGVISPGAWQPVADTKIQGAAALLEDSTIMCNYGGATIQITDHLQVNQPTQLQPVNAPVVGPLEEPEIVVTEWKSNMEEGGNETTYTSDKVIEESIEGEKVWVEITTLNILPGEELEFEISPEKNKTDEMLVTATVGEDGKAYALVNTKTTTPPPPEIKEGWWTDVDDNKITEARLGDKVRFHIKTKDIKDGETLNLTLRDWDGTFNPDDYPEGAPTAVTINGNKGHVEFTVPQGWKEDIEDDYSDEIELYFDVEYQGESYELPTDSDDYLKVYPKAKAILVFYHGGPFGSGKEKEPDDNTGHTGKIYEKITTYIESKGIGLKGTIIAPAVTQGPGVNAGVSFITENYVQGDQIIIYGYSYGGDNAVNLAEAIKWNIDTMIIVDSSDGPFRQLTVDRSIPDNVDYTLNIYQGKASGGFSRTGKDTDDPDYSEESTSDGSSNTMGSRGFPHSAEGDNIVENINATDWTRSHGYAQQDNEEQITGTLKYRIDTYEGFK